MDKSNAISQINCDRPVEGHFTFKKSGGSFFQFGLVRGFMDCHYSSDIKSPSMEFTWEGSDEMDPASGSGRIEIIDGKLEGIIYFHLGDESTFTAEKTQ